MFVQGVLCLRLRALVPPTFCAWFQLCSSPLRRRGEFQESLQVREFFANHGVGFQFSLNRLLSQKLVLDEPKYIGTKIEFARVEQPSLYTAADIVSIDYCRI